MPEVSAVGCAVDRPEVGPHESGEAPLVERQSEGGVLALEDPSSFG